MSTSPVTLMVARRVAKGRYEELMAWLREGEQLATDFPGYLGSGVLAPPPHDDEFQIIFRFADEKTLHAWEFSASRSAWLSRGSELFADPSEHRVSGIDGWFGAAGARPPRWKQAVAIWLAFFPGIVAVQLRPGAAAQRVGPVQPRTGEHRSPDPVDGLFLYTAVDPSAGELAAPFAPSQGHRSSRLSTGRPGRWYSLSLPAT